MRKEYKPIKDVNDSEAGHKVEILRRLEKEKEYGAILRSQKNLVCNYYYVFENNSYCLLLHYFISPYLSFAPSLLLSILFISPEYLFVHLYILRHCMTLITSYCYHTCYSSASDVNMLLRR
jgi:hypothetical protein